MRKLLLVSGVLAGSALLAGSPASADQVGCACVKLGAAPVCVASIDACVSGMGGLCISPCDYKPPKMMKKKSKKSMKKM